MCKDCNVLIRIDVQISFNAEMKTLKIFAFLVTLKLFKIINLSIFVRGNKQKF